MAVYYYLSTKDDHATQQAVLAYTHDDVFKPVPGFKVVSGHFHLDFNEQLRDLNTFDYHPSWVPVFRGLGINVVYLGDFHDDSDPRDPGPKRLHGAESTTSKERRRLSDKNFLLIPAEEVNCLPWWPLVSHDAQARLFHSLRRRARISQSFEETIPSTDTSTTSAHRKT